MEHKKLKAINANQEEFEALYREVMQDFSDFEKQVKEINFQNEQTNKTYEFVHKLLDLTEGSEDEDVNKYRDDLFKTLEQLDQSSEERAKTVDAYNETFNRAEQFIEMFKEDLVVDTKEGTVVLGTGALMLLEYMHTIRKTLQEDEKQ